MLKRNIDKRLSLWLIYERPAGYNNRFLAKKWFAYGDKLIPSDEDEIVDKNVDDIRKRFMKSGYTILPKRVGIVIDIWLEPDQEDDNGADARNRIDQLKFAGNP